MAYLLILQGEKAVGISLRFSTDFSEWEVKAYVGE